MKLADRGRIVDQVLARQVGEETVMLDLANGEYFGLDPVGSRIWQLLGEGIPLADICEAILDEYAVSREEIERDVLKLADELSACGLIIPE